MHTTLREEDADFRMILDDMSVEYLTDCDDRLDQIDEAVADLGEGRGRPDNLILEIKRLVHSIKGAAGTFGFPSISIIAHALEDYIETQPDIGPDQASDIGQFIGLIRRIVDDRRDLSDEAVDVALRNLRLNADRRVRSGLREQLSVLLLMPKGIQRTIIGRELTAFGFRVITAHSSLQAIDLAIARKPDLVIASMYTDRLTGAELARVFHAIRAMAGRKFMLLTSVERPGPDFADLPGNVTVVRKGMTFSRDLIRFLRQNSLLRQAG